MNNKEFHVRLAKKTSLSQKETSTFVDSLVDVITEALCENDKINISGFGIFEVKKKMERVSVNPKSGVHTLIPPKLVSSFRPNNNLKEKFK